MHEDERITLENGKFKALCTPPSPHTPVGATHNATDLVRLAHATRNIRFVVGTPIDPLSETFVRHNIVSTESTDLRRFTGKCSAAFTQNVHVVGIPILPVFVGGLFPDFPPV